LLGDSGKLRVTVPQKNSNAAVRGAIPAVSHRQIQVPVAIKIAYGNGCGQLTGREYVLRFKWLESAVSVAQQESNGGKRLVCAGECYVQLAVIIKVADGNREKTVEGYGLA
jgi:hypothetical protein